MSTKKKSDAVKFLENLSGGALTFGALLESIREGEEISQVAFAKKLKISKAHLCDLEKGRRLPSPSRAAKFAKILGYSPERFVKVTLQEQLDREHLDLFVEVKAALGILNALKEKKTIEEDLICGMQEVLAHSKGQQQLKETVRVKK